MQRCSLDKERVCDNSCIAFDAPAGGCRLNPTTVNRENTGDEPPALPEI